MVELDRSAVVMLDDFVDVDLLADTLRALIDDPARRKAVGRAGKALIAAEHTPEMAGRLYRDAIETFAVNHPLARNRRLLREAAQSARLLAPAMQDMTAFAAASAVISAIRDAAGCSWIFRVPSPMREVTGICSTCSKRSMPDRT